MHFSIRPLTFRSLVLLLVAVPSYSRDVHAQKVCLQPTAMALEVLDGLFLVPDTAYRELKRRYRVPARAARELAPLTDVDSSTCRELNRRIWPHPVYYLKAGDAILATNYSDSLMLIVRNEFYPLWRIFDLDLREIDRSGHVKDPPPRSPMRPDP